MAKRSIILTGILVVLFLSLAGSGLAEEKATPQEVYEMVVKAANMIEVLGDEGIAALSDSKEFVWKDSYVWAVNCSQSQVAAHPNKKLIGLDLSKIYDKNPNETKRKLHNLEMCSGANNSNGVWVEYWWEKLGETQPARKVSFMIQVPNQPYQVTAGIYDEMTSIDDLNKISLK